MGNKKWQILNILCSRTNIISSQAGCGMREKENSGSKGSQLEHWKDGDAISGNRKGSLMLRPRCTPQMVTFRQPSGEDMSRRPLVDESGVPGSGLGGIVIGEPRLARRLSHS